MYVWCICGVCTAWCGVHGTCSTWHVCVIRGMFGMELEFCVLKKSDVWVTHGSPSSLRTPMELLDGTASAHGAVIGLSPRSADGDPLWGQGLQEVI